MVCSELDAERAGRRGVEHVAGDPQRLPAVAHPVGRAAVGTPPTVLFQGLLRYPPNIDAARWLAPEVGPALRALVPDAEIRLVGEHPPELAALDDRPRFTVAGRVPDIATELARADVVVVPVRYGSGTRLKILEAFAHRMPVVSTTLGAEGLGAEDGVHLLLGDTAHGPGRGLCPPAARAGAAGRRWCRRAHELFLERFQSDVIEAGRGPVGPGGGRRPGPLSDAVRVPRGRDGRASLT